jgi:Fe-Mn family superoxide dismutase
MNRIEPRKFLHLVGYDALSERSLREHYRLYEGYVEKYNELSAKLQGMHQRNVRGDADSMSLKVDITFALSGIKNHELFFDTLGHDGEQPEGSLHAEIVKSFHSIPQFMVDLKQTALVGRGWAWTAYDLDQGHLFNYAGSADGGIPVWNTVPILAIDLYGHAYFYDFGNNKMAYVEAVMQGIGWRRVGQRLDKAMGSR